MPVWLNLLPALAIMGLSFFVGYVVGRELAVSQSRLAGGYARSDGRIRKQRIINLTIFVGVVAVITPLIAASGLAGEMMIPGILILVGCIVGHARTT